MKQIEVQLRDGMARQGITGDAAEQIITSITSFALYGFPESHAASFALLAYASAYLKAHYPGGVLHGAPQQPADGVLPSGDARQGRAAPRRPLSSDRRAGVRLGLHGRSRRRDPLGLRYVSGLREEVGKRDRDRRAGSAARSVAPIAARRSAARDRIVCPKCGCDDASMLERSTRRAGSATTARTTGPDRRRDARRAFRVARRSRRAHRPAPRRSRDARRHRRAQRVRLRPPVGAVAGRARRAAGGELFDDDQRRRATQSSQTRQRARCELDDLELCASSELPERRAR